MIMDDMCAWQLKRKQLVIRHNGSSTKKTRHEIGKTVHLEITVIGQIN